MEFGLGAGRLIMKTFIYSIKALVSADHCLHPPIISLQRHHCGQYGHLPFICDRGQAVQVWWERWLYGILAAYLFYFLHVLSVRSGLALGYAGILLLVFSYFRHLRRWKQFAMIGIMVLAPIVAYKIMPGFEKKINYTLYDLGKFNQGEGAAVFRL